MKKQTIFMKLILVLVALTLLLTLMTEGKTEETAVPEGTVDVQETTFLDGIYNIKLEWPFSPTEELLEIWFPKIHDCDTALVLCGGQSALIDTGTWAQAPAMLRLMEALGIEKVDALYNSHPHPDHLGGFATLADKISIGTLFLCFEEDATETAVQAVAAAEERNIPVRSFANGDSFPIGSAILEVYLSQDPELDLNNGSAVMNLSLGERSMLFLADLEKAGLQDLMANARPSFLDVEVIKHPHHGMTPVYDLLPLAHIRMSVITNSDRVKAMVTGLRHKSIDPVLTVGSIVHLATNGKVWFAETYTYLNEVPPHQDPAEVLALWEVEDED